MYIYIYIHIDISMKGFDIKNTDVAERRGFDEEIQIHGEVSLKKNVQRLVPWRSVGRSLGGDRYEICQ